MAVQSPAPTPSPSAAPSPPPRPIADLVEETTGSELLGRVVANTIEPVLQVLLIVVIAWVVSRLARRLIGRMVQEMKDPETSQRIGRIRRRGTFGLSEGPQPHGVRRAARADALGGLARSVASVVIWGTAIIMILGTVGISIGPLIASAGIIGIALGFGAQDLVKDFISGVFMLLEDQYGLGDIIDVGEAVGVVEGVTLRSTRIRGVDGTLWHVPNGEIRRVGNKAQDWSRAVLDVAVAYGSDIERAGEVILAAANEVVASEDWRDVVLEEPELWGVEMLGADGVMVRLVVKVQAGQQFAISRPLRQRIKDALDEAGIEIPFPQRVMWLRREDGEPGPAGGGSL